MTRRFAFLPVLVLSVLLGGCFPRPDYRDLPNASSIGHTVQVLDVVAVADASAPTAHDRAAIAAALARGGDSGLRVRVLLPRGVPVPAEAELRDRIRGLGIDPAIAVVAPEAGGEGTQLVFVRVTVSAPDCAALVTPSEAISAHARPTMAFGCATYTNLSRMVADPADLVAPRSFGGADGAPTASAIDRYRRNEVTPLRSTSSLRGIEAGGSP